METKAIAVEKVVKNYGGVTVLKDVYLTLEVGEFKAIIGPNGAGKTTLFNVITGVTPASSGKIFIFGHEVTGSSIDQRARMGLGRTFQANNLFLNLTVLENTLLAIRGSQDNLFRIVRAVKKYVSSIEEAEKIIQIMQLWDKKDTLVKNMSYGEQRRLEIGLGLAAKPKILLMDEPTAGLSASEFSFLIELLQQIRKDTTILLIAHDIDFVLKLADRIVVLNFGEIVVEGTKNEIAANNTVREIYIGKEFGT